MPPRQVDGNVLLNPDFPGGLRPAAIGGHGHKVNLAIQGDRPDHVGKKHHDALEHADENGVFPGVIGRQLPAQLSNAGLDLVLGQENALYGTVHSGLPLSL